MANWWDRLGLHVGFSLCILVGCLAQGAVEGFEGGAVVLPCTVSIQGMLRWRVSNIVFLIRLANGSAIPPENSPWKYVVSFVGSSNNVSISPLSHQRDDNRTFWCEGLPGGRGQHTIVRVLARITGASIEEASGGRVTVTEGTSKTLTCVGTGNPKPNPAPSYSWRVDNGRILGQRSSYTLTANRSMRNITCTAINTYSNGNVLSTAEATATLNVLYLDAPSVVTHVNVTENEAATLPCSADGNPPPTFEWRRSGSAEVMSTSADYRIENVRRSAALEYTCNVTNIVGSGQTRVKLVVQYGLVTAPGGGGAESNTGAIVGGVLGSLVGILVICAGVVIVLQRHKTKGSPEIAEDRHMTSIGENNEAARHFPADADNIRDPNVSQAQYYETLNQFHVVGSNDRTYDQLHVPVIGTNNMYENTEVPGTSTRTTTSRDNYETLDQTHSHAEGSPVQTYDQLHISMRGKSGAYENTEVTCRSTTKTNDLSYENVNV